MEEKKINIKLCEYCGKNATYLCFECLEYYCDTCFKIIHERKLKSKHKKENADPYVPFDLKCPNHPNNAINLFCIDEKGKFIHYYLIIYSTLLCLLPF